MWQMKRLRFGIISRSRREEEVLGQGVTWRAGSDLSATI